MKIAMKTLLSNTIIILVCRILLGTVFIVASIDKIANTNNFITSILNYKIVDITLATVAATFLPPLELLTGICLILGIYPKASSIIITSLLFIFTIFVISALVRGLDISCGCFSQDPNVDRIGYKKIIENFVLMIIGGYLIIVKQYGPSLYDFTGNTSKK